MASSTTISALLPTSQDRWRLGLIRTKLSPPKARQQVNRPALIQRLQAGLERRLTVLVAPAGFGKTTLLGEWYAGLRREGYTVAWLSLDQEDDDLTQFSAYLMAAIGHSCGDSTHSPFQQLNGDAWTSINAQFNELVNELAVTGKRLVVILDDADRLQSTGIREALFRLLRHAPENFHMVMAGRAEPIIPLSYFALRDQLVQLDIEQMRFDAAAASEFFAQATNIVLDAGQVQALVDATEGWVAGLQLASLTLCADEDPADLARRLPRTQRSIGAYLEENVLVRAPAHILDFLLKTSILERLSPDLCNAVTGAGNGAETLAWLVSQNMFIRPLSEGSEWYRYHALFSEYLRSRLARKGPAAVSALHRKASEWYAGEFLWPEAVRHALAAGDIARATSLVDECAMNQVEISEVRTVLGWVSRLPAEAYRDRLNLRLAQSWALALSLQIKDAKSAVQQIEADIGNGLLPENDALFTEVIAVKALIAGLSDESTNSLELGRSVYERKPPPGSWVDAIGLTTYVFGLSYGSRFEEVDLLRKSTGVMNDTDPLYSTVYRQSMFGLAYLVEGRLHDAARILEAVASKANERIGRYAAASVLPAGYLATIYYEWNEIGQVREIVQNRLETAIEACSLGPLAGFYISSARLAVISGDFDEAERLLHDAEAIAQARGWLRMEAACKSEAIRLCIRHGELPRAARVLLAVGLQHAGATKLALQELAIALRYGQRNSMARSIIDEGEVIKPLLEELHRDQTGFPYLERWYTGNLLNQFQPQNLGVEVAMPTGGGKVSEKIAASRLSAREIEILDHVARGLSNKEIARAIRVAPETVKWHLKNIYEKLNVTSRIQAVQSGLGFDLPRAAGSRVS
ncbi:LuxR C-terminal-related transcriptional regulator [Noviherbaspirillum saxi]|uniref:LuxR C-terminal-related transcriptional regulator n=1 Tax=Noviherbaspirillum saxi TaxID=2320863 RepID=UPI0013146A50|nr:LuxR C-terminal-related transcriptional regulator [Noviherbaspirillum saxi]